MQLLSNVSQWPPLLRLQLIKIIKKKKALKSRRQQHVPSAFKTYNCTTTKDELKIYLNRYRM